MDKLRLIPLLLVCSFSIKMIALGASFTDAPIIAILAGLAAYLEFSPTSGKLKEIDADLQLAKKELTSTKKDLEDLKTHVVALKMGQQYKLTNNVR